MDKLYLCPTDAYSVDGPQDDVLRSAADKARRARDVRSRRRGAAVPRQTGRFLLSKILGILGYDQVETVHAKVLQRPEVG